MIRFHKTAENAGPAGGLTKGFLRSIMMMVEQQQPVSAVLRIRRALALPIYMLALLLDFAGAGLSCLAAWIAGDAR